MSDIEPEKDLSPQTVQVLAGWMRRQEAARPPMNVPPVLPELVFYLCNALPPEQALLIEDRLIASGKALRLVRAVRADLRRLEAMPWQAVAEAAQGGDQTAEVAAIWLGLAAEQMQAAERAPALWLANGWQTLRNQVETGVGEALSTWNAFLAFGTQWGRELLAPGRFAVERGDSLSTDTILPGVTDPVEVEAEIDEDDALNVTLRIQARPHLSHSTPHSPIQSTQQPASQPQSEATFGTALEGRLVLLALRRGTEIWPIATARLSEGRAEWHIPGFGAATGMPPGEIPLEALQFTFTDTPRATPPDTNVRLLAEFTDHAGNSTDRRPVPVIFLEEPRWEGGEFLARVELPPETHFWLTARYQLRLDVAVSGTRWQHLGAWTLGDGDDAHRTLQTSCPGSLDVILPSVTLIRAQLRPPE